MTYIAMHVYSSCTIAVEDATYRDLQVCPYMVMSWDGGLFLIVLNTYHGQEEHVIYRNL
jgi:hypothetical protein